MSRTPGLPARSVTMGESVVVRDYSAADVWRKPDGVVAVLMQVLPAGWTAGDPPSAEQWFAGSDLSATEAVTFGEYTGRVRIVEFY